MLKKLKSKHQRKNSQIQKKVKRNNQKKKNQKKRKMKKSKLKK